MTTSGPYDATSMTTSGPYDATSTSGPVAYRDDERRPARETKPSFKTTELIVYVLAVIGVLIAPGWSTSVPTVKGSAPIRAGSWSPC
jgi:hypothetical protein